MGYNNTVYFLCYNLFCSSNSACASVSILHIYECIEEHGKNTFVILIIQHSLQVRDDTVSLLHVSHTQYVRAHTSLSLSVTG